MSFELFESDGSRWLYRNIYATAQTTMYVGKKKKKSFFTLWALWYRGAILLAEIWGVGVRKLGDLKMVCACLVSFELNTPRI
jgi:hypothetical protein